MNPPTKAYWVGGAMVAVAVLALVMRPESAIPAHAQSLDQLVPHSFGDWQAEQNGPAAVDPTLTTDAERDINSPYDEVVTRTYRNGAGESIMLALAYGRHQRQEVKIHRPELCYISQGFSVQSYRAADLHGIGSGAVPGTHMVAVAPDRLETITFWVRIGETFGTNPWSTRYYLLREGLSGRIPDGILVRASQIVPPDSKLESSFELQERFLRQLVDALPPDARARLLS